MPRVSTTQALRLGGSDGSESCFPRDRLSSVCQAGPLAEMIPGFSTDVERSVDILGKALFDRYVGVIHAPETGRKRFVGSAHCSI